MDKDFEIILKECGNKKDAEKHIKDGYIIYTDDAQGFEEFRASWLAGLGDDDLEEIKRIWSNLYPVEYEGAKYRIDYCL